MAATYSDLITVLPEFSAANGGPEQTYVEAQLAQALLVTDPNVWGDLADQYQIWFAAAQMARSPWGYRRSGGNPDEAARAYEAHLAWLRSRRGRRGLVVYGAGTRLPV